MTEKMERPAKDVIEERVRRIQKLKAEKAELEAKVTEQDNRIAYFITDAEAYQDKIEVLTDRKEILERRLKQACGSEFDV